MTKERNSRETKSINYRYMSWIIMGTKELCDFVEWSGEFGEIIYVSEREDLLL
jgi:hypothetical protein